MCRRVAEGDECQKVVAIGTLGVAAGIAPIFVQLETKVEVLGPTFRPNPSPCGGVFCCAETSPRPPTPCLICIGR